MGWVMNKTGSTDNGSCLIAGVLSSPNWVIAKQGATKRRSCTTIELIEFRFLDRHIWFIWIWALTSRFKAIIVRSREFDFGNRPS